MNAADNLLETFARCGGDPTVLKNPGVGHLLVSGHQVVSSHGLPGLELEAEPTTDGIRARLRLRSGIRIAEPLHLCFGIPHDHGQQHITMELHLEPEATLQIVAHCLFPAARRIRHSMDATVRLEEGAELHYSERHVHGPHGGILVVPRARVSVGPHGRYRADFSLTAGRVGELDIDYRVEAEAEAIAELTTRLFGHGSDRIRIREEIILAGEQARGLVKSRIALEDDASAEVLGMTEGLAAGARGHVDCLELVKDRAIASAIPEVKVSHPQAKVTHEAAIGSIDQRQLETLMAHGLDQEEAINVIVEGILH